MTSGGRRRTWRGILPVLAAALAVLGTGADGANEPVRLASVFGASNAVRDALPAGLQATSRYGISELERRTWACAAEDTHLGLACNVAASTCPAERRRAMALVPASVFDDDRRRRLRVELCGESCVAAWNRHRSPGSSILAKID